MIPARLTRAAEADIQRAAAWYEEQSAGLGSRFTVSVLETVNRISLNPLGYRTDIKDVRIAIVTKFPYALWFRIEQEAVVIARPRAKRDRVLARERAAGVIEMPKPPTIGQ